MEVSKLMCFEIWIIFKDILQSIIFKNNCGFNQITTHYIRFSFWDYFLK